MNTNVALTPRPAWLVWALVGVAGASVASGCGDDEIAVGTVRGGVKRDGGVAPAKQEDGQQPSEAAEPTDDEFVEGELSRDPFRSFLHLFQVKPTEQPLQRRVIMPTTGIEEMRLVAIVSGVPDPRAMFVDRDGVGHTVRRGDYIGRPEVIQTPDTEGVPITLNWRVERIHGPTRSATSPGGTQQPQVILSREDPTAPDSPPLRRAIALRDVQNLNLCPGSVLRCDRRCSALTFQSDVEACGV